MTKKQKIAILVRDNKRLLEENKKLKERENAQLVDSMIESILFFDEINKNIFKLYKQLNKLKWNRYKFHCIYNLRFGLWRFRKKFGI